MKKLLLVAVVALASVMAYAQPRAIGLRLGEFDGVSYQHGFGDSNMLEIEAGFNLGSWYGNRMVGWESGNRWELYGYNVQLAVTYDWIDPFGATFPWEHKGEWHWYLGFGAAGGYGWYGWTYVPGYGYTGGSGDWGFAAGAGRAGVEYDFWFPLQISIDFRPTIGAGLVSVYDPVKDRYVVDAGLYYDVLSLCLGVRYKF